MYRDGLCPLCGRPLDVCTSVEGVGPDFEATYTACRATAQILAKQRALAGSKTASNDSAAFLFTTTTKG
jgi:hypothetical protein